MQDVPSPDPPPRSSRRRVGFAVVALVLCALVAEVALRGVGAVWPEVGNALTGRNVAAFVDDDELGIRLSKEHHEHDELGFRNVAVPDVCDLVALGDSQTYGTNVPPDAAWPQQLAAMTGRAVYNMGTPGHGPTQSLLLLDVALARSPATVVVTLYPGNDLYDCYNSVHRRGAPAGLATEDAALRKVLADLDGQTPLEDRIGVEFARVFGEPTQPSSDAAGGGGAASWLADRVRLVGLLRAGWRALWGGRPRMTWESVPAGAASHPGQLLIDTETLHTALTPAYRLAAADLDEPRLKEGLRIALDAVAAIAEHVRRSGAHCAVLLIPSKESVCAEAARDAGTYPEPLRRLLEHEDAVRAALRARCAQIELTCIDALPALREALRRGVQPYPFTADGHPNRDGHRAIASAVAEALGAALKGK